MVDYNDIKKGIFIIISGNPFEIMETQLNFRGRGKSVIQAKIRNLATGEILSRTFHPGEKFEEADISRTKVKFLYSHRDRYFFCKGDNPSERFYLEKKEIGEKARFLKENSLLEGLIFNDKVVDVVLPIKIQLKVIESPPGLKTGRAEAGTKQVVLETGAKINAPIFIKEGDIVEVNTESGEYVRRITE
jgi:elongation factor P